MIPRRALVVTFDQLPASILGCYGNEWIETPNLDQLAAAGFVADQCWSTQIGPTSAETAFGADTCLAALTAQQVQTTLLLEDASQTLFPLANVQARKVLSGDRGPDVKPERIAVAELVRAAQTEWESWHSQPNSAALWLHARGLEIPALPPSGFAELYQDEFEDRGVNFEALSDTERLTHPIASAGLVSLFDHWLGQLFADIQHSGPLLTVVTAAAGARWQPWPNSFGEMDALRSQMVQVPWIVRMTGETSQPSLPFAVRSRQLISLRRLGALLEWWFCEDKSPWADWLAAQVESTIITRSSNSACRITRTDWSAIFAGTNADSAVLFRKPEDFWEVNNQATVQPETVLEWQQFVNAAERRDVSR